MDAQPTQTLPNSCDSSWKRIVHEQAKTIHILARIVAMQTVTPTAPPSGPKWTIMGVLRGVSDGGKQMLDGVELLRKLWMTWRAISLGYLGHSLARWLGLL